MNAKLKKMGLWFLLSLTCILLAIIYAQADLPVITIGADMEGF